MYRQRQYVLGKTGIFLLLARFLGEKQCGGGVVT